VKRLVILTVFIVGTIVIWLFDDNLAVISHKFLFNTSAEKLIATVEFLVSILIANAIIDIVLPNIGNPKNVSADKRKTALQLAAENQIKLSPDFLLGLINTLRNKGFTVGTDQACSAYDVVLAKEADKRNPVTIDQFRYLLAPIFCSSPGNQDQFYDIFSQCFSEHYGFVPGSTETGKDSQITIARNPLVIEAREFWYRVAALFIISILCLYTVINIRDLTGNHAKSNLSFNLDEKLEGRTFDFKNFNILKLKPPARPADQQRTQSSLANSSNTPVARSTDNTKPGTATETEKSHSYWTKIANSVKQVPTAVSKGISSTGVYIKKSTAELSKLTLDTIQSTASSSKSLFFSGKWPLIIAVILLFPISVLFWVYLARKRRKVQNIQRQFENVVSDISRLFVRRTDLNIFSTTSIHRATNAMKRHRHMISENIDVRKTVSKSIHSGGYFQPVYKLRPMVPDYLVLLDRVYQEDHMKCLVDVWLAEMRHSGVYMDVWYFSSDPRFCRYSGEQHSPVSFEDLASRYCDHRLIIISDVLGMFDTVTGNPFEWLSSFEQWQFRAVVTPQSAERWGYREWELGNYGFAVVPLSTEGFAMLGHYFLRLQHDDSSLAPPVLWPSDKSQPYPESLWKKHETWLSVVAPGKSSIQKLCEELKVYLGDAYQLLTACAVYPKISWNLTLYIDHVLSKLKPDTERYQHLLRLARLPWFQHNYMPDYLRAHFINNSDKKFLAYIRSALTNLMYSALNKNEMSFAVDLAHVSSTDAGATDEFLDLDSRHESIKDKLMVSYEQGKRFLSSNLTIPLRMADKLFRKVPVISSADPQSQFARERARKRSQAIYLGTVILMSVLWLVIVKSYRDQEENIELTRVYLQNHRIAVSSMETIAAKTKLCDETANRYIPNIFPTGKHESVRLVMNTCGNVKK